MSSKVLDQIGRTGAFHHFIRRKALIIDMGLDNIKTVARHADSLPLTGDGVLGIDFENKLKERKEKNKEYKDLIPEVSVKQFGSKMESYVYNKCTWAEADALSQ